jgi:hypothetical protein
LATPPALNAMRAPISIKPTPTIRSCITRINVECPAQFRTLSSRAAWPPTRLRIRISCRHQGCSGGHDRGDTLARRKKIVELIRTSHLVASIRRTLRMTNRLSRGYRTR